MAPDDEFPGAAQGEGDDLSDFSRKDAGRRGCGIVEVLHESTKEWAAFAGDGFPGRQSIAVSGPDNAVSGSGIAGTESGICVGVCGSGDAAKCGPPKL